VTAEAPPPGGGRPRPAIDRDTEFFWSGVAEGRILIQRCSDCGALRHPPRPMCPSCASLRWVPVAVSGRGAVHSYAVHHHPPVPGFSPPFIVVLADLDEGVRLLANLSDCDPSGVAIGMAVEAYCAEVEPGYWLPQFRPADPGGSHTESRPPSTTSEVPLT
jgi:hypothetical protein